MTALAGIVSDFEDEYRSLRSVVQPLAEDQWYAATPAAGWDVRDSISHLADTDDIACHEVVGGSRSLVEEATRLAAETGDMDAFTAAQVERGRALGPAAVLAWWDDANARLRAAMGECDPDARIPWGPNRMSPVSFITARLMETWAHGLDVRAAVGDTGGDSDRLRHVAFIAVRALPHAFNRAGKTPPAGTLRVELTAPSGAVWSYGPDDATATITGPAAEFCRVAVQRLPASAARSLTADGALANQFLQVARAFL